MRKIKSIVIAVVGVLFLVFIIALIIMLFRGKEESKIKKINEIVNPTISTISDDKNDIGETTIETTEQNETDIEEFTPETFEPIRPEDETAFQDNAELAEFDYSGFEYWQQNVFNTVARTITNSTDSDKVIILDIVENSDSYYLEAKIDNSSKVYYAKLSKPGLGIVESGTVE